MESIGLRTERVLENRIESVRNALEREGGGRNLRF